MLGMFVNKIWGYTNLAYLDSLPEIGNYYFLKLRGEPAPVAVVCLTFEASEKEKRFLFSNGCQFYASYYSE